MKEIWKDIPNYEGLYQASNLGRIKRLENEVWNGYQKVLKKEHILKPRKNSKGYIGYALFKNGIRKDYKGHWLILNTYIKNVDNKPMINHKNGIKDDNRLFNLEWCDNRQNIIHALENGLFKNRKRKYKSGKQNALKCLDKYRGVAIQKAKEKNSIIIVQYDNDGNFIAKYNSIREAERILNITHIGERPIRKKYYFEREEKNGI